MDKFSAINEKMGELDGTILEYEIRLRELKLEKTTYENAKTLIIFGSLDEQTEDENESIEPDVPGDNPYKMGGMLFNVTNKLFKSEKRIYTLPEIADLMNFDDKQARLLGVNLSGTALKKICYFRVEYDVNGNKQRGVYGLIKFKHLYGLHPKNLKQKKFLKKLDTGEKKSGTNPFKVGGNLRKAYKIVEASRRKMSVLEIMTNCKIPDDERKNFGNKIALAATEGKGFIRVGVGFYGVLIHKHLYDI